MQWLLSLVFTLFMFGSTVYYCVYAVVTSPWCTPEESYVVAQRWASAQLWGLKVLCGLDYLVEGREHIPAGNHISLWKHSSMWETLVQMLIFPPQSWVLKQEIMWIPIVGWAAKLMRPIAIDRSAGRAAVQQVLAQGKERLAAGLWILVFPEGTRVPAGQRRKFGIGGALLAVETGRKIVPVAHDAGRYWARRGLYKRRGTVRVVIGPPIEAMGRDPRQVLEDAKIWIDHTTTELGA